MKKLFLALVPLLMLVGCGDDSVEDHTQYPEPAPAPAPDQPASEFSGKGWQLVGESTWARDFTINGVHCIAVYNNGVGVDCEFPTGNSSGSVN